MSARFPSVSAANGRLMCRATAAGRQCYGGAARARALERITPRLAPVRLHKAVINGRRFVGIRHPLVSRAAVKRVRGSARDYTAKCAPIVNAALTGDFVFTKPWRRCARWRHADEKQNDRPSVRLAARSRRADAVSGIKFGLDLRLVPAP
jgi:hypothetical protein